VKLVSRLSLERGLQKSPWVRKAARQRSRSGEFICSSHTVARPAGVKPRSSKYSKTKCASQAEFVAGHEKRLRLKQRSSGFGVPASAGQSVRRIGLSRIVLSATG